jgi:hypothetical protein
MNTIQDRSKIFGKLIRTSRRDGNVIHLLCKCGVSTQILSREFTQLLSKNSLPNETKLETIILENCPSCVPNGEHKASVQTGDF